MKLGQKIREKNRTIYQILAERHNVSISLVRKIGCGVRVPKREKSRSYKIYLELKALADESVS